MQVSRADVQVVLPVAMQHDDRDQVGQQPERSHDQHHRAADRLGVAEALVGLDKEEDADHDQRHGVEERRQDLGAFVAKRLAQVGALLGVSAGQEGDEDGRRVAQIVDRIGEQREAVRDESADDLHERDREVQCRCPEQFAPLHVGPVVVMVRMTVAVRVITVVIVFVVMMGMHNVDLFLMWIRVDKDKQPARRTSFAIHHSPRPRKAPRLAHRRPDKL